METEPLPTEMAAPCGLSATRSTSAKSETSPAESEFSAPRAMPRVVTRASTPIETERKSSKSRATLRTKSLEPFGRQIAKPSFTSSSPAPHFAEGSRTSPL